MAKVSGALADRLTREWSGPRIDAAIERAKATNDRYARDPFAHCVDGHIWIEDLETGAAVRLVPYEHQIEFTEAWIDLELLQETGRLRYRNIHEEKSRQMGFTWWVAYLCCWALTHHDVAGLALFPNVGDAADSGMTTDSFFGRIKFIADYGLGENDEEAWPAHLRPSLAYAGGNNPIVRNLHRPRAFLAAEGATPTPGRGKKYAYGFLDEFAYHPFARAAHRALSRAIPNGRFYNSTPHGEDNVYAWLRRIRPRGYTFLRHHWSQHRVYGRGLHLAALRDPETREILEPGEKGCKLCKGTLAGIDWDPANPQSHRYPGKLTSPWFEQAIVELTDEDVASELEIDYTASIVARVYASFSEDKHVARVEIPFDEALPIELSIDYGVDTTAVTICQDAPMEYRMIGEVELHDTMPEEVVAAVRNELIGLGVPEWWLDPGWMRSHIYAVGDPAGEQRQGPTARPLTADYRRLGLDIVSRPQRVNTTIRTVRRLLNGRPKPLVISPRCTNAIDHFKHNRYPVDKEGVRKPDADPLNDRHNHMMRGFSYLATMKFPPPATKDALQDASKRERRADWMNEVNTRTGRVDDGIHPDMQL